jgi:LuxR family maltose regulon positive regulatory protein
MFHIALLKLAAILVTAPVARKQARQVFALLRQLSEPTNNARVLIETLALEAVLDDAEGDREAALEKLTQALTLAEPSHLIRAFVDLGPAVGNLLYQLVARGVALDYLSELLAAFVEQPGPQPASRQAALIEPLSQRELQVLALLADRLSNKEIAQALNISPMTVKRHTVNIYQKLLVATRRDAVAEAVKLGLVPEHSPATRSRML